MSNLLKLISISTAKTQGKKQKAKGKGSYSNSCFQRNCLFNKQEAAELFRRVFQAKAFRVFVYVCLVLFCASISLAGPPAWRQASEKELRGVIPARAPVEKERIETEFRTASGVTDGRGKFIAGVVMITAGYAAEGKYSHFFITQVPMQIEAIRLPAGEYVFGFKRVDESSLEVKFYEAANGKLIGAAKAIKDNKRGPVRSLLISPPANGKAIMQIGRFLLEYKLSG